MSRQQGDDELWGDDPEADEAKVMKTGDDFRLQACHECDSDDIEGGPVEIDDGLAIQEITCSACGATRTEFYKFYLATAQDDSLPPKPPIELFRGDY